MPQLSTSAKLYFLRPVWGRPYIDLIEHSPFEKEEKEIFTLLLKRFFDRVEIRFCKAWVSNGQDELIAELQGENRLMTNEIINI